MNSISVKGEEYVKASSIARELGYTSDYVGQLCRSGKVDAQLVGRSWYVNQDSIQSYKKTRYRSNVAKSKIAVQEYARQESEEKKETVSAPLRKPSHFYNKITEPTMQYKEDTSELIPKTSSQKKSKKLHVSHADEQKLQIKSVGEQYQISTPEMPKVVFKGSLAITDSDNTPESGKTENKAEKKQIKHLQRNGVISMKKPVKVTEDTQTLTTLSLKTNITRTPKKQHLFITAALTSIIALAVTIGFLGLEQSSIFTESGIEIRYQFDFASAISAFKYPQ